MQTIEVGYGSAEVQYPHQHHEQGGEQLELYLQTISTLINSSLYENLPLDSAEPEEVEEDQQFFWNLLNQLTQLEQKIIFDRMESGKIGDEEREKQIEMQIQFEQEVDQLKQQNAELEYLVQNEEETNIQLTRNLAQKQLNNFQDSRIMQELESSLCENSAVLSKSQELGIQNKALKERQLKLIRQERVQKNQLEEQIQCIERLQKEHSQLESQYRLFERKSAALRIEQDEILSHNLEDQQYFFQLSAECKEQQSVNESLVGQMQRLQQQIDQLEAQQKLRQIREREEEEEEVLVTGEENFNTQEQEENVLLSKISQTNERLDSELDLNETVVLKQQNDRIERKKRRAQLKEGLTLLQEIGDQFNEAFFSPLGSLNTRSSKAKSTRNKLSYNEELKNLTQNGSTEPSSVEPSSGSVNHQVQQKNSISPGQTKYQKLFQQQNLKNSLQLERDKSSQIKNSNSLLKYENGIQNAVIQNTNGNNCLSKNNSLKNNTRGNKAIRLILFDQNINYLENKPNNLVNPINKISRVLEASKFLNTSKSNEGGTKLISPNIYKEETSESNSKFFLSSRNRKYSSDAQNNRKVEEKLTKRQNQGHKMMSPTQIKQICTNLMDRLTFFSFPSFKNPQNNKQLEYIQFSYL